MTVEAFPSATFAPSARRAVNWSRRFRERRAVRLRELIGELAATRKQVRIIDLGGSVPYWRTVGLDFLREHRARVTVLNNRADDLGMLPSERELFGAMVADACDLSAIDDGAFDLAHSNSVIEHVGDWARMKRFAAETSRVGRAYYAQTPYFWFPIDPHYHRFPLIHWLPRPAQATLLHRLPLTYAGLLPTVDAAYDCLDGTRLLDARQMRAAFPDGEIERERFAGLTKSLIAVRRA
jgi:hypothetical protein